MICEGNVPFSKKVIFFFFLTNQRCTSTFSLPGALRSCIWIQPSPVSDSLVDKTSLSKFVFELWAFFCLYLTCSLSIGTLYNSESPSFWENEINVLDLKAVCLDCFYFSKAFHALRWCLSKIILISFSSTWCFPSKLSLFFTHNI